MQLHFTATGNFRGLSSNLAAVDSQINRTMAGTATAFGKATHPLNQLNKQLETTGRLTAKQFVQFSRQGRAIMQQSKAIQNAVGRVYQDGAGNAQVMLDVNRRLGQQMITVGDRFRFANTMVHAFGRGMIAAGKQIQWAGRQITVGITVPLALIGRHAGKAAEEYNRQFTRILKVNNEASRAAMESEQQFELVSQSIRRQSDALMEYGASMGFMAAESSKMVAELSQMGYVGTGLTVLSEQAMKLSRISGTELTTSLELARLSAQAFNIDLNDLEETFARLNLVENNTALSLDELAQAFPVVAGVVATMGVSVEETAGLLAMMKENGIGANEGATALRTGLLRIVQEATDPAIEAFERIGLNLEEMQERMNALPSEGGGGGDVLYFFDELSEKLNEIEGRGEAAQAGLNEFAAAISKMVGVRSSARFLSFLKEIGDRQDENTTAGRAWVGVMADAEEAMRVYNFEAQLIEESAAGIADRLRAELNLELVRLGENFLGIANTARQLAINMLQWFNNLDTPIQRVVLGFLGVLGALGPLAMLTGIITNAFGQFFTIITKFLPKFTLFTTATMAQKLAQEESANAAVTETGALTKLTAARHAAASAADRNAISSARQTAAMSGSATAATASTAATGARAASTGTVATQTALGGAGWSKVGASGAGAMDLSKLGIIKAVVAALPKIFVALAAFAAKVIAVVAIISAIPILANPQQFAQGFMEAFSGPLENIREAWGRISAQVQRILELFRSGASHDGLGRWAEIVGQIAGTIGGLVVNALAAVMRGINMILNLFEGVFRLVEAIAAAISGDWSAAGNLFLEFLKAMARALTDMFVMIVDMVAALVEAFSFMPGLSQEMADSMRDWAQGLTEAEWMQSAITDEMVKSNQEAREFQKNLDQFNDELAESEEFMQGLADAGVDITKLTEENVRENKNLTEEMQVQIIAALRRRDIEKQINDLIQQRGALEGQLAELRRNEAANIESIRWTARALSETNKQIEQGFKDSETILQDLRDEMEAARTAAMFIDEHIDDAAESAKDLKDETEASKAAMDALEKKAQDLRDRIRESERAAQAMASALRSAMGEVMNDIVAAVNAELDAQQQRITDQFDARVAGVNEVADAELAAIDEMVKKEAEQERARRRFFEREKARIEYLKGMQQGNVQMQEALARGEVSEAAIIRIGLQADAERYMLDSYQREADAYADNRRDEIQSQRDAINETRRLALERIEIERDAAQKGFEARRAAIERYLRDWQRITPATEAEFRRHLAALGTNLNGFGVSMASVANHYTNISGQIIVNGFARAVDTAAKVVAENDKWNRVGQQSGARFRAGLARELAKVEQDLDNLRSGKNVNVTSSGLGGSTGTARFDTSNTIRLSSPPQMQGWSLNAYEARMPPVHSTPFSGLASGMNVGNRMLAMHSGGEVSTRPNMPGLRPDEQAYVLQRGEYVIQKDAVDALGPGYLEMLNSMKKHDGGLINFAGSTITEGSILGAISGFGLGGLATMAAADIITAGGGKPKQDSMSDDVGPGRGIGIKAGDQISETLSKFMAFAMEGSAGGWRPSSSGWPPRRWATISPNTAAARNYWASRGHFPGGIGDGVHRGVESSDHSWGKALDFMVAPLGRYAQGAQKQLGWQIANWHLANPNRFGTKYVIWDKLINSGDSRGWRNYTRYGPNPGPTLGHYDHVHVSYMHDGGLVPSLRTGGKIKFDNTLANLHKGERVLTEPSTRALEAAIQNFAANAGGGGDTYEITINVDGTGLDESKLASKIMDKIELQEMRKGRKRVQR